MDGSHSPGVAPPRLASLRARLSALAATPAARWGWKAIVAIGDNNVFGLASQLAYSFLFALFPFVLCLIALGSYLPGQDFIARLLSAVTPFLPASSYDLINSNAQQILKEHHAGLISLGFVIGLWSNSGAISGLLTSLNQVYRVTDRRSVIKTRGISIGLTLAADLLIIVTCLLMAWGGSFGLFVSKAMGRPALYSDAWAVLRWPAAVVLLFGMVIALYRLLPDIKLRFRDVVWGAVAAVGAWVPVTLGFSWYLKRFPSFGAAYGSLGAVIVLLTWLYLNGLLLVLGGQINALIAESRGLLRPKSADSSGPDDPVSHELRENAGRVEPAHPRE